MPPGYRILYMEGAPGSPEEIYTQGFSKGWPSVISAWSSRDGRSWIGLMASYGHQTLYTHLHTYVKHTYYICYPSISYLFTVLSKRVWSAENECRIIHAPLSSTNSVQIYLYLGGSTDDFQKYNPFYDTHRFVSHNTDVFSNTLTMVLMFRWQLGN